ncbi:hypothetical protein [Nonomuraea dietziae]|uniref:hypothetical protein n=1 Tax=Nonomuraea dietziae TaxID=65515 RepID=UPI0031D147AC
MPLLQRAARPRALLRRARPLPACVRRVCSSHAQHRRGDLHCSASTGQARRSDEMLAELAAASVTASFAPERLKAELLRGIDEWLAMPV